MFLEIIVCILAGMGAGLGTGFAGMSAAAIISPVLIVFLDVPPFTAVGIALASDVLASAVSAYAYYKHKNIDLRNSWVMMLSVLLVTVAGTIAAHFVSKASDNTMTVFSIAATVILGLRFLIRPVRSTKESMTEGSKTVRLVKSVLCGIAVGFICGFMGAGGGIMMLLLLTGVLGYELKTAIGTSVFIMSFTALIGAASHFVIDGFPDWVLLVTCALSTLVFARIAVSIANKASNKVLNRIVGGVLTVLGVVMLIVEFAVKK